MAKQFTLGKNERLKSRRQIELLFNSGKKFSAAAFRVVYLVEKAKEETACELKFGISVSNKNFKKAVDRNRIKRLVREAWRLQKNMLKEHLKTGERQLDVFFIYTGKEIPDYKTVYENTGTVIHKLIKAIEQP